MVRTKTSSRQPPQVDDAPEPEPPIRVYQHASIRREKGKKKVASSSSQPSPPPPPPHDDMPDNEVVGSVEADDYEAELENEIPDPQDTSLLASYPDHVACLIWQGKERGLLGRGCNRSWRMPSFEELPQPIREIVETSGLAPLVGLSYKTIDKRLLSSFVERWYSDTNTFHLPVGEMTLTLDDISSLLHIPVRGRLIPWSKPAAHEAVDLMKALLGVSDKWAWDETQKNRGGAIRFLMLEELFDKLVNKKKYIEAARCYLLCLVGSTLFLDKSMTYVGCQFLTALEDVYNIQHYAWGACALAHLYAELAAASKKTTKQLGGYGTLLEAWIKEYFPNIGSAIPRIDYQEDMPRASKWDEFIASGNMDVQYRSHLESLRVDQVRWQPYDPEHRQHRVFEEVSLYSGYLRCGDIRRAYLPERVLRQFGYVQTVPRTPPIGLPEYSEIDAAFATWTEHVLDDATRGRLVRLPGECSRGYLDWVYQISHPYLMPQSQRIQNIEATRIGRYQERLNRIGELTSGLQGLVIEEDVVMEIQNLCHIPIDEDVPNLVPGRRDGGRRVRKRS